jgi:hypothetical protein
MAPRVIDVRRFNRGLRWTLDADGQRVYVDTLATGGVFDTQGADGFAVERELDERCRSAVRALLAARHSLQRLDDIDVARWGRIQRPADRARFAA